MGLIERLSRMLGGGTSEADAGDAGEWGAGPQGRTRTGPNEADAGAKSGSHGGHWDAVVEGDDEVREAVVAAVEEGTPVRGAPVDGAPVVGYRHGDGPLRTVAVTVDGRLVTGYPDAAGVDHAVTVGDVRRWANGVEAQVRADVGGESVGLFATDSFVAGEADLAGRRQASLAALAYELGPAEDAEALERASAEARVSRRAGIAPLEGGDVDDYLFQTVVKEVDETTFAGRRLYRLRAPLLRLSDADVDVSLYAGEHVLREGVPEPGDEVEGVAWLQGRLGGE